MSGFSSGDDLVLYDEEMEDSTSIPSHDNQFFYFQNNTVTSSDGGLLLTNGSLNFIGERFGKYNVRGHSVTSVSRSSVTLCVMTSVLIVLIDLIGL